MPKAKPTQVIVHRIELQEKERELVEGALVAKGVKDVSNALFVPVLVSGGLYIGYKYAKAIGQWGQDLVDDIKQTPLGAYAASVPASGGATLPSPALRGIYRLVAWLTTPQN